MGQIVKIQAIGLLFSVMISACISDRVQFKESEMVAVDDDCDLYVFYPKYTDIEFKIGKIPDLSDHSVVFCCGAAFTRNRRFNVDSSNVAGPYVSNGSYHAGYPCVFNTSVFAYYDNVWHFASDSIGVYMDEAVSSEGMAFCQIPIPLGLSMEIEPEDVYFSIGNYRFYKSRDGKFLFRRRDHKYRALCEKSGRLCVAQSQTPCSYSEFCDRLKSYGISEAIYLDVGLGWSYGWYRLDDDSVQNLDKRVHPFVSNWLVFRNSSIP